MLEKLKSEKKDDTQAVWDDVMQIASASTEQLELYRTQTLVKLDITLRALARNIKTIKNLLIALLVFVVIIALLM